MPDQTFESGLVSNVNGKYVSADQDRGNLLVADRDWYRGWEQLKFVKLDDGDNIFAIQSRSNGKYVAVEDNCELRADRDWIRGWEKFELKTIEETVFGRIGRYAFKSLKNGCWVAAEQPGGLLIANRDQIRGWEEFHFNAGGILG